MKPEFSFSSISPSTLSCFPYFLHTRSLDQLLFPVHLATARVITSTPNICPFPLCVRIQKEGASQPQLSQVLQKKGPGEAPRHQLPEHHSHFGPSVSLSFSCSSHFCVAPSFLGRGSACCPLRVFSPCPLPLSEAHLCTPSEKLIALVDCHPLHHFLDKTFVLALQVGLPCIPEQSMGS